MSALAFLSGLAQGAGEEASKQGEQRRQLKNTNDQALAETIHKRLETDDTLDFPTYQSLRSQEYKLRGIKTADISQLLQHEKSVWDVAQQHRQSQANAGADVSQNELPNPIEGITPSLPAGPDFQGGRSITTGDLKSQAAVRQQNALNDAAIQKQRQQFQLFKEQTPAGDVDSENGTHYTNQVTMGPNGPTLTRKVDPGRNITGVERGADILARNPKAQQRGGVPIDPNAYYQGTQYSNQDAIYDPRTPTTRNRLEVDETSPTGFAFQAYGPNNEKIGPAHQNAPRPSSYTEHVVNTERVIQWIDPVTGEHREERVPIRTTNTPTAVGGPTGPLPAIAGSAPSAPVTSPTKPVIKAPVVSSPATARGLLPSSDPAIHYLTGQVASGDLKLNEIKGDGVSKTEKQLRGEVQNNLAALGLDINHPTTGQKEVAKRATAALGHIEDLEPVLARLGKAGQLGPFSGRVNNFLTTTVGVDPTTADGYKKTLDEAGKVSGGNGDYTTLLVNAKLLQSLLTQVHTSRTSNLVLEKMTGLFEPGKMDLNTLQASLTAIKPWLDTYAKFYQRGSDLVPPAGPTSQVPQGPANNGSIVDQLLKDHGFGAGR